jgi:DNA-binding NarL/FixJ family response regulator
MRLDDSPPGTSTAPPGTNAGKRRARRVLIVDDYPIVRQGLRRVMENEDDLTVCGEAVTASDTHAAISSLSPDALICDICLAHVDGIELVRYVRAHHPRLPILVMSTQDEAIYAERMLAIGATGYIMKHAPSEQLLVSLRCVLDGKVYVSEQVAHRMIQRLAAGSADMSADPIDRLSDRELQVLLLIGNGVGTREIAHSLHLSVKTVESHRQRIKRKLNLCTGTQLQRFAVLALSGRDGWGGLHATHGRIEHEAGHSDTAA